MFRSRVFHVLCTIGEKMAAEQAEEEEEDEDEDEGEGDEEEEEKN